MLPQSPVKGVRHCVNLLMIMIGHTPPKRPSCLRGKGDHSTNQTVRIPPVQEKSVFNMWVVANRVSSALAGWLVLTKRTRRPWLVRPFDRQAGGSTAAAGWQDVGGAETPGWLQVVKHGAGATPSTAVTAVCCRRSQVCGGKIELVLRFAVDLLLSLVSSCHWGNNCRFWEAEFLLVYPFMWYFLLCLSVWIFAVCFCLCLNYLPSLLLLLCQTLCVHFKNKAMDTDYFKSHVSASRPCPVLSQ